MRSRRQAAASVILLICAAVVAAQTRIEPPNNSYKPSEDVTLGLKAASDVEKQLPVLDDEQVGVYIRDVGGRLATNIPAEFNHPEFQYTFKVVDVKDINAFALPGGPMYVHRGIIEASKSEGELAGVMAHEMGHVALRHGTAQMAKAKKFSLGILAGAVVGVFVGGDAGRAVFDLTQFGISATFLRFSRDDEKQADLFGVQLLARAGYDPRDLARMFETIEKEGGDRPPQWLSDHPNPGNRVAYINQEAASLPVAEAPIRTPESFVRVQDHLKTLPPAKTLAELSKKKSK
jgi:predicted Zn-dependent protease